MTTLIGFLLLIGTGVGILLLYCRQWYSLHLKKRRLEVISYQERWHLRFLAIGSSVFLTSILIACVITFLSI